CLISLFIMIIYFYLYTATIVLYTLSLHDALPISTDSHRLAMRKSSLENSEIDEANIVIPGKSLQELNKVLDDKVEEVQVAILNKDRKSTRLNSSHVSISYAVFCLKKKT